MARETNLVPYYFLTFLALLAFLPCEVAAFGAGDIPDFAYLNG